MTERAKIEKHGSEIEPKKDFAEELCRQANEYLHNFAFPVFRESQTKLENFTNEITERINSGQKITQKDFDRFTEILVEVQDGVHRVLQYSEQLDKEDFLFTTMLDSRIHRVKNEIFGGMFSYYVQLREYIETGENIPRYDPSSDFEAMEFHPEDFRTSMHDDFGETIDDAHWYMRRKLEDGNIEVTHNLSEFEEKPIFIDHLRRATQESFLELFKNAIDAMPNGGKLNIKLEKKGENAVVTVSDTGVGIPKENLTKIFEKGFTTKTKGTGRGLPLLKVYFEDIMHGKFELDSEKGKGTTVTITLPISKEQKEQNE